MSSELVNVEIRHYQGRATFPHRIYHRVLTVYAPEDRWCLEIARGKNDRFKMVQFDTQGKERTFQWRLDWKPDRVYIEVGDFECTPVVIQFRYICPVYPDGVIGAEVNAIEERPIQDFYGRVEKVSRFYLEGTIVGYRDYSDDWLVRVEKPERWVWVDARGTQTA